MQQYNYAEEIIKDFEYQLPQNDYVRSHVPKEEIVNTYDQEIPVNGIEDNEENENLEVVSKVAGYKEGLKDDSETVEEGNKQKDELQYN